MWRMRDQILKKTSEIDILLMFIRLTFSIFEHTLKFQQNLRLSDTIATEYHAYYFIDGINSSKRSF